MEMLLVEEDRLGGSKNDAQRVGDVGRWVDGRMEMSVGMGAEPPGE